MPPDPRESSPSVSAEAARRSSTAIKTSPRTLPPPAHEIVARRRWAYSFIRRAAEPPPIYGSREWLELTEGTPAKIASVIRAAECWATEGDELPERLALELENARAGFKFSEDAAYQDRAQAHREHWESVAKRSARGRTFTERRAEQLASVKPRPGDYTGQGSA